MRKRPRCGHAKQQGLLSPKKRVIHCETSGVSRKSPRVFVWLSKMSNDCAIFFAKNATFRKKILTFALDKTQPFLFPSHCGVPIAQILQALPRASAQTIFDMLNIASLVPGLLESQGKARGLGTLLYVVAPIVPQKNTPSLRQGGARGFVEKGRRCAPDQYLCSLSANSLCVRLLRSMLYQA